MRHRRHLWFLVIVAACGGDPGARGANAATALSSSVPDPIVLRIARGGGTVRAYQYPRLDSLIWTSTQPTAAPGIALAFDQENGILAYVDQKGLPGWIDLRVGRVDQASRTKLDEVASADAWAIYGVARDTTLMRLTPGGEWTFSTEGRITGLYPQPDGALVLTEERDGGTRILRLRPPESTVHDSASLPAPSHVAVSPLGDRLYFAAGVELLAVPATALGNPTPTLFSRPIVALATTPSGDRVFVLTEGSSEIAVLDRYSGERGRPIPLPGPARALRVDPLGRLLLARPDSGAFVWVVSVGTGQLVATFPTAWRSDLPTVAPDGSVATVTGRDVSFVLPSQTNARIIVKGGANEFWHFVLWNGFRPRAKGLDQPVVFQEDSTVFGFPQPRDSVPAPAPALPAPEPPRPAPVQDSTPKPVARDVWTVSFAALLSDERAQALARSITVDGQRARVVVTLTEGVRVHRVVLGPYRSRAEAERVGRASGQSFWVFEGLP